MSYFRFHIYKAIRKVCLFFRKGLILKGLILKGLILKGLILKGLII